MGWSDGDANQWEDCVLWSLFRFGVASVGVVVATAVILIESKHGVAQAVSKPLELVS